MQAQEQAQSAIRLEGIAKHYLLGEERLSALRGISLRVPEGTFMAICGPSGSGKSTLLNICGLIDSFDAGRCFLAGEEIGPLDEDRRTQIRRARIGFIFQNYNLIPVMSVFDNVAYPLHLLGWSPTRQKERVRDILEQVGLAGLADRSPERLSGGQRQRVAIARALVKHPALVIADEPTANLDTRTAEQIIDLMKNLGQGSPVTFLIATHDLRMAGRCDQTCSIVDGTLQ
jgi:putative ABC transport system ATP-binding protein